MALAYPGGVEAALVGGVNGVVEVVCAGESGTEAVVEQVGM